MWDAAEEPIVRSRSELEKIRDSVDRLGRLSDSLVRLGPLSLGLDGVLSWIPGVGEVYSVAAGGFILVQAVRARAPLHVILTCAALMASRTAVSALPLAGPAAADLFTAHKWSARMVVKAIDKKLAGLPETADWREASQLA